MFRPAQIGLVIALILSGCESGPPTADGINPYEVLPGKWGWRGTDDCKVAPVVISFSSKGRRMHLSHATKTDDGHREARRDSPYTVLGSIPNGLHVSLDEETRKDASGQLVTWDLVLPNQNEYCWHRSDWPAGGCTKSIDRCEI
jgi:hypothetical protein